MIITLTRTVIDEALNATLAEVPTEYKYPYDTCSYVMYREPACLVGKVLARVGVPLKDLEHLDRKGDGAFDSLYKFEHLLEAGIEIYPDDVDYLASIQRRQDQGTPWHEAVRAVRAGEDE